MEKYNLKKELKKNSENFSRVKGIAIRLQEKNPNRCVYCGKPKIAGKPCNCLFGGSFG